jgi:protein subunit release factor A
LTLHKLDRILDGELGDLVEALTRAGQEEQLRSVSN